MIGHSDQIARIVLSRAIQPESLVRAGREAERLHALIDGLAPTHSPR